MPICMCGFLSELLEARLCVVRDILGCGVAVAHGCVFRMSLRNPFPLMSASPGPGESMKTDQPGTPIHTHPTTG